MRPSHQMMDLGRYLADEMLMRLARWLRMAGHDVSNPPEGADDSDLIELALAEGRTLLTRDKLLARRCENAGASCLLVRSPHLDEQLSELWAAGVSMKLKPRPERCTLCNGILRKVGTRKIDDSSSPVDNDDALWRCEVCGKLYWRGAHWQGIRERLEGRGR
ncbi:MAG: Uncharacterized protein XD72_0235 [Methanothrix harundinacea]|uniref:Mut7-C RNAse domain-containing protein n=1 Tax=Methanothrix harundinacea TaxID=301375 RepID=A0A101IM44_9EURY|nr:MAG: Uncharacterized protein XD72_0235 [Methanothrix harundinacea]KUK97748.1 MAG: Uncharacterized protein XE07_0162 [Methanothrix harundinacea]